MATYALRGLSSDLVARAKAKARESETTLDAILTRFLETYAEHGSIQSSGGHARKLSLTATERSDIARRAARSRWKDREI